MTGLIGVTASMTKATTTRRSFVLLNAVTTSREGFISKTPKRSWLPTVDYTGSVRLANQWLERMDERTKAQLAKRFQ